MRRLWIIALVCLMVGLACDFSVPDISSLSLPEMPSLPEINLSQFNLSKSEVVQGSGQVVDEKRLVEDFTEITLSGIGNLVIEQGDSESLTIHAEDNLIEYISSEVNGKKLVIGVQPGITLQPSKTITYRLKVKSVEMITLTGSGSIETAGIIGHKLKVNTSGSGQIKINNLDVNGVTTELSGSGGVVIGGDVGTQTVTLSGSGSYKSNELKCGEASVKISGSGSAYVAADHQLKADISGSGSIHYTGNPEVEQNITGSGQIVQGN
jgi:hypothetical protein